MVEYPKLVLKFVWSGPFPSGSEAPLSIYLWRLYGQKLHWHFRIKEIKQWLLRKRLSFSLENRWSLFYSFILTLKVMFRGGLSNIQVFMIKYYTSVNSEKDVYMWMEIRVLICLRLLSRTRCKVDK